MPFGLTNAPATAQRYMNDTLREFLDQFYIVYIDDILIYSKNKKEHHEHVCKILAKLKEANAEKCEFNVEKTMFLGFIISANGIEIDLAKIEAILNWETPNSVRDVQSFLGFANFYRRFIHKYSNLCQPLFTLLRKPENQDDSTEKTRKSKYTAPFVWSPECDRVFRLLKTAFTLASILRHFDPNLETILECDASDYVVSGILSQKYPHHDPDTRKTQYILHPVTYMSEKNDAS